jgi:hypothetical protein
VVLVIGLNSMKNTFPSFTPTRSHTTVGEYISQPSDRSLSAAASSSLSWRWRLALHISGSVIPLRRISSLLGEWPTALHFREQNFGNRPLRDENELPHCLHTNVGAGAFCLRDRGSRLLYFDAHDLSQNLFSLVCEIFTPSTTGIFAPHSLQKIGFASYFSMACRRCRRPIIFPFSERVTT